MNSARLRTLATQRLCVAREQGRPSSCAWKHWSSRLEKTIGAGPDSLSDRRGWLCAFTERGNCNKSVQKPPDISLVPEVREVPSPCCWIQIFGLSAPRAAKKARFAKPASAAEPCFALDHAADDVDAHGQDGDIEDERKHAVNQGQPSHGAGDHGDIGDLRGHAHHEGVIGEI
jgi:hypothetical protein